MTYSSYKNKSLKNPLFLKFPSKVDPSILQIIQCLHNLWNKNYFVHSLDLAWDIEDDIENIHGRTNKRKQNNVKGTKYYGRRNSWKHKNHQLFEAVKVKKSGTPLIKYRFQTLNHLTDLLN